MIRYKCRLKLERAVYPVCDMFAWSTRLHNNTCARNEATRRRQMWYKYVTVLTFLTKI